MCPISKITLTLLMLLKSSTKSIVKNCFTRGLSNMNKDLVAWSRGANATSLNLALDEIRAMLNAPPIEVKPQEESRERLPAFIITDLNDSNSMYAARRCLHSIHRTKSLLDPLWFPASDSTTVHRDLNVLTAIKDAQEIPWTWPTVARGTRFDVKTGYNLEPLETTDEKKEIVNTVNHMRVWQMCIDLNRPIVVLQQDAIFNFKFSEDWMNSLEKLCDWKTTHLNLVGLNSIDLGLPAYMIKTLPQKAGLVHPQACQGISKQKSYPLPPVFPSKSGYYITPWACVQLFKKVEEIGMWPIHHLINLEFFPWITLVNPRAISTQIKYSPVKKD